MTKPSEQLMYAVITGEEKPKPMKKISQSRAKRKLTGKARKGN